MDVDAGLLECFLRRGPRRALPRPAVVRVDRHRAALQPIAARGVGDSRRRAPRRSVRRSRPRAGRAFRPHRGGNVAGARADAQPAPARDRARRGAGRARLAAHLRGLRPQLCVTAWLPRDLDRPPPGALLGECLPAARRAHAARRAASLRLAGGGSGGGQLLGDHREGCFARSRDHLHERRAPRRALARSAAGQQLGLGAARRRSRSRCLPRPLRLSPRSFHRGAGAGGAGRARAALHDDRARRPR